MLKACKKLVLVLLATMTSCCPCKNAPPSPPAPGVSTSTAATVPLVMVSGLSFVSHGQPHNRGAVNPPLARPCYCLYALATSNASHRFLRWEGKPATIGDQQLLLVVSLAHNDCAFPGGSPHPRIATATVEDPTVEVTVEMRRQPAHVQETTAALVPWPHGSRRLALHITGEVAGLSLEQRRCDVHVDRGGDTGETGNDCEQEDGKVGRSENNFGGGEAHPSNSPSGLPAFAPSC